MKWVKNCSARDRKVGEIRFPKALICRGYTKNEMGNNSKTHDKAISQAYSSWEWTSHPHSLRGCAENEVGLRPSHHKTDSPGYRKWLLFFSCFLLMWCCSCNGDFWSEVVGGEFRRLLMSSSIAHHGRRLANEERPVSHDNRLEGPGSQEHFGIHPPAAATTTTTSPWWRRHFRREGRLVPLNPGTERCRCRVGDKRGLVEDNDGRLNECIVRWDGRLGGRCWGGWCSEGFWDGGALRRLCVWTGSSVGSTATPQIYVFVLT